MYSYVYELDGYAKQSSLIPIYDSSLACMTLHSAFG